MSILTDLDAYRKNMAPNNSDDVIQITTDRKTAEWIAADLRLREKKLSQAVNDTHTKARKRDKKELELHMLTAALQAINAALNVADVATIFINLIETKTNEEEISQHSTPLG